MTELINLVSIPMDLIMDKMGIFEAVTYILSENKTFMVSARVRELNKQNFTIDI